MFNAQGDVIGLIDKTGAWVVKYTYDAWGKSLTITDGNGNDISANASHVGNLNPFRYRGYYYDTETGLFYVGSRYYDPEIGRFINADGYVSTGQGLTGNNMFSYCGNNPVNRADPTGKFWILAVVAVVAVAALLTGCSAKPAPAPTPSTPAPTPSKPTPAPSTPAPAPSKTTPSVPAGGTSVHKGSIRICTDGSNGKKVPDSNWQAETAYSYKGKPLDAYTVSYVVRPIGNTSIKMGDSALLINHDTGLSVMCVVGEAGPAKNGWGEVSIAAIWDTGNPGHMTANHTSGLSTNYEIILYPGVRYEWGN